jgi:hypothetical protein
MALLLCAAALLALFLVNYLARSRGSGIGKIVLIATSLPAAAAVAFTGFRLGYAIINADEVNRRFQHGDLTYFGAGIAFVGSFLLTGLWVFLAYTGFRWGRDRDAAKVRSSPLRTSAASSVTD